MRSYWVSVGHKSNNWCPDKKIWGLRHREERPCEEGVRDWTSNATSQRTRRIAGNCQKLGQRHELHSSPELQQGIDPVDTLILDFWPPRP